MIRIIPTASLIFTATLMLSLSLLTPAFAKDKDGYKGWEIGSPYNKLYDPKERDSMKGNVKKFTTVKPLPGMAPGTALILVDNAGDTVLVHLCPVAYAKAKETGLRKGDRVKVKGSWVEIDDEDVFIASKVKRGEHFQFKVRLTSDGTPFWTMSPEQLKKELAAN